MFPVFYNRLKIRVKPTQIKPYSDSILFRQFLYSPYLSFLPNNEK